MSLWFSGADSSYKPAGGGFRTGSKGTTPGCGLNSQTETVHRPHGKMACDNSRYCNPSRTALDFGALEERNCYTITPGDKRGKKPHEKLAPSAPSPRRVASGSAAPPRRALGAAPFALGDQESAPLPYHQQKKHVSPPKSNQKKFGHQQEAEDMFLLKRSRTPPASERNRPKTEGFCILHGFDARVGKFTREMMRVVPSQQSNHGKASAEWEKEITERRDQKEDHRQAMIGERARLALLREGLYHNDADGHAAKVAKGRASTPNASHRTPYATGLPTPRTRQEITPSIPKWRN